MKMTLKKFDKIRAHQLDAAKAAMMASTSVYEDLLYYFIHEHVAKNQNKFEVLMDRVFEDGDEENIASHYRVLETMIANHRVSMGRKG